VLPQKFLNGTQPGEVTAHVSEDELECVEEQKRGHVEAHVTQQHTGLWQWTSISIFPFTGRSLWKGIALLLHLKFCWIGVK
jgi:hypothetical protein